MDERRPWTSAATRRRVLRRAAAGPGLGVALSGCAFPGGEGEEGGEENGGGGENGGDDEGGGGGDEGGNGGEDDERGDERVAVDPARRSRADVAAPRRR